MKVCFVLSASVQCLLRLSQNEEEGGNGEDMACGSVEPSEVVGAVEAATVREAWPDGCARVERGASASADKSTADRGASMVKMMVGGTLNTPPRAVVSGEKERKEGHFIA